MIEAPDKPEKTLNPGELRILLASLTPGMTKSKAYGAERPGTERVTEAAASRFFKRPIIVDWMAWYQHNAEVAAVFGAAEALVLLAEIARDKLEESETYKEKTTDRIAALSLAGKMCGWFAPTTFRDDSAALTELAKRGKYDVLAKCAGLDGEPQRDIGTALAELAAESGTD